MTSAPQEASEWPTAMATVLSCRYEMRAGRALAFGLPSGKHFRIAYNYWAGGELHQDELFSAVAMPVGSLFEIHYDPELPHQSRHASQSGSGRGSLLAFGLLGSVLLSLLWAAMLRGCH